ncbi:hypothetical protein JXB02_05965 [Candidatus Woesearchaeota archaeon]|nr:hypothetical protein [Candidatus Woesearchaeota archaeon]
MLARKPFLAAALYLSVVLGVADYLTATSLGSPASYFYLHHLLTVLFGGAVLCLAGVLMREKSGDRLANAVMLIFGAVQLAVHLVLLAAGPCG